MAAKNKMCLEWITATLLVAEGCNGALFLEAGILSMPAGSAATLAAQTKASTLDGAQTAQTRQ